MGKCVHHCIECKLEDPLRKVEDSYGPILGCTAFILPHSQPLYRKAAGVSQSGGCVLSLDLGLDTKQDLLLGGSGILLHHPPPGEVGKRHAEVGTHGEYLE